ncbi:MAG: amino acid ABC transporter permease, partial [Hyphomicrobiales bacterium]
MSVSDVSEKTPSSLGAMWRDKKTRAIIMQIVAVIAVLLFFGWLVNNTVKNIENLGVKVGFDFLGNAASYDINQTLVDYSPSDTHLWAGFVGLLNTLLVAVCGVVLATILGFSAGVARLSNNFVLSRLMQVYVEAVRNVPVLLQILLWYGIILHSFPKVKAATPIIEGVIVTNRGIFLPQPLPQDGFGWVWIAFFAGIIGAFFFKRYAKKVLDATGKQMPVLWGSLGLIIGLPIIVYFLAGSPLGVSMPELKGFNYKGGFAIKPEFLALWLALSIYT